MREEYRITKEEFGKLQTEGCAAWFDLPCRCGCGLCGCGGYFSAQDWCKRKDVIICCTNEGYFLRNLDDLDKSQDGFTVRFCENSDGKPLPNFEDVFTVEEY